MRTTFIYILILLAFIQSCKKFDASDYTNYTYTPGINDRHVVATDNDDNVYIAFQSPLQIVKFDGTHSTPLLNDNNGLFCISMQVDNDNGLWALMNRDDNDMLYYFANDQIKVFQLEDNYKKIHLNSKLGNELYIIARKTSYSDVYKISASKDKITYYTDLGDFLGMDHQGNIWHYYIQDQVNILDNEQDASVLTNLVFDRMVSNNTETYFIEGEYDTFYSFNGSTFAQEDHYMFYGVSYCDYHMGDDGKLYQLNDIDGFITISDKDAFTGTDYWIENFSNDNNDSFGNWYSVNQNNVYWLFHSKILSKFKDGVWTNYQVSN